MASLIPFNRDQALLLPPDLKSWLPDNDLAHVVVAAVERVPLTAFVAPGRTGGKPQTPPLADAGLADLLLRQRPVLIAAD